MADGAMREMTAAEIVARDLEGTELLPPMVVGMRAVEALRSAGFSVEKRPPSDWYADHLTRCAVCREVEDRKGRLVNGLYQLVSPHRPPDPGSAAWDPARPDLPCPDCERTHPWRDHQTEPGEGLAASLTARGPASPEGNADQPARSGTASGAAQVLTDEELDRVIAAIKSEPWSCDGCGKVGRGRGSQHEKLPVNWLAVKFDGSIAGQLDLCPACGQIFESVATLIERLAVARD